jgi:hypothetical protein
VLEHAGFSVVEQENPTHMMAYLNQRNISANVADLIFLDMNFSLDTTSAEESLRFFRARSRTFFDQIKRGVDPITSL